MAFTCKWSNKKTHCARSDGRVCTISATRYGGRKGYQARVWRGDSIRSVAAKLIRSKAAAQLWCLHAGKRK